MDAKTLEALKASIAKWEMNAETARISVRDQSRIAVGVHAKGGVLGMARDGCPLCALFNNVLSERSCEGCPVKGRSEKWLCRDTPYDDVSDLTPEIGEFFVASEELVSACEAEVDFLRSLLPAEG